MAICSQYNVLDLKYETNCNTCSRRLLVLLITVKRVWHFDPQGSIISPKYYFLQ